jgi:hypothetical protein
MISVRIIRVIVIFLPWILLKSASVLTEKDCETLALLDVQLEKVTAFSLYILLLALRGQNITPYPEH